MYRLPIGGGNKSGSKQEKEDHSTGGSCDASPREMKKTSSFVEVGFYFFIFSQKYLFLSLEI